MPRCGHAPAAGAVKSSVDGRTRPCDVVPLAVIAGFGATFMLLVERLKKKLYALPGIQSVRERRYERRFIASEYPCFRGVYRTFEEARASAPNGSPIGFDDSAALGEFADRHDRIFPYDYPVMFWLRSIFADHSAVFDWGGHLGVHYHAYQRYLAYPAGLTWTVCEVPKVAEEGRARAERQGESALRFTVDPRDVDGHDVLLTAGALQYVEGPSLQELLASLRRPPTHLLVNKAPLYDGPTFVTLQNVGFGFAPYWVWNRAQFLGGLARAGYAVIDAWDVPERDFQLPFHPERSFRHSSGVYLKRSS